MGLDDLPRLEKLPTIKDISAIVELAELELEGHNPWPAYVIGIVKKNGSDSLVYVPARGSAPVDDRTIVSLTSGYEIPSYSIEKVHDLARYTTLRKLELGELCFREAREGEIESI